MGHSFRVGEQQIGVRSTSAAFGAWAKEALRDYWVPDPPLDFDFSVVVGEAPDGAKRSRQYHILYRSTLTVIRSFDLEEIGRALVGEVARLRFYERDDAVYAEAGLLWKGDAVALIPGTSSLYVASVGRSLHRAGYELSDQSWVVIEPSGRILPPGPHLGIDQQVLEELRGLEPVGGKSDRRRLEAPTRPDVVCSIGWDSGLAEVSHAVAVHRLATHVMNLPQLQQRGLDALAKLVVPARCFEVGANGAQETLDGFGAALELAST
ncbi:MAG TPA: hypothetical protein VEM41_10070 [Actinomycetota bacterium]|nr:hypothetical protein [Actinomycetota bacterium]